MNRIAFVAVLSPVGLGFPILLNSPRLEAQSPNQSDKVGSTKKVRIKFKKPRSVSDVVKLKDKYKLKLDQVDSELLVGDKPIYGMYPSVDGKSVAEIEQYIEQERLSYFADMVAGEDKLSPEERVELKGQFDYMKQSLQNRKSGNIEVLQILTSGEDINIEQLGKDSEVGKLDVEDKEKIRQGMEKQKFQTDRGKSKSEQRKSSWLQGSSTLLAQTTGSTWYPNSGRSETGQSANAANERYTKQYMRWNGNRFGADETYEHEFYLDATDGNQTYLSTNQNPYPNCGPIVTSAQSTWPALAYPYLDTRLEEPGNGFCESGNIGYVVGAAQASAITAGVTHNTYIRTANGNASTDRFYLSAQLGWRWPLDCASTWCSYGYTDVNRPKVVLVSPYSVNVPGVKDWVKP